MPKRPSKADQRKWMNLLGKRQGISLSELKKRLKSYGDSGVQEAEGVWTTEAGQNGVAEEGGNNTPALGTPAHDRTINLGHLSLRPSSVTREMTGEAKNGHSPENSEAKEAEDGHSNAEDETKKDEDILKEQQGKCKDITNGACLDKEDADDKDNGNGDDGNGNGNGDGNGNDNNDGDNNNDRDASNDNNDKYGDVVGEQGGNKCVDIMSDACCDDNAVQGEEIGHYGEWVCNGVWLNDVTRAPHWY
jgi:hypothetical protein